MIKACQSASFMDDTNPTNKEPQLVRGKEVGLRVDEAVLLPQRDDVFVPRYQHQSKAQACPCG